MRLVCTLAVVTATALSSCAIRYSTGCVTNYTSAGCAGSDLPEAVPEGADFRFWYDWGDFDRFSAWNNGNVWGSDFRDASSGDLEPNGGSDVPHVYLFAGHGICQDPPNASSDDFIVTCGNFGTPDTTTIGDDCRWGDDSGELRFMFVDASCPMDLVSIENQWFGAFRGLHMAVGHSGTITADALDSRVRGNGLGAYTSDAFWLIPHLGVGDAWMAVGIDDVQAGCCAVALAAGNNRADAIDRRENERVKDGRSDPTPNWFAWRWICR